MEEEILFDRTAEDMTDSEVVLIEFIRDCYRWEDRILPEHGSEMYGSLRVLGILVSLRFCCTTIDDDTASTAGTKFDCRPTVNSRHGKPGSGRVFSFSGRLL